MSAESVTLEDPKQDFCSLLDRITDLEDLVYGVSRPYASHTRSGASNGNGARVSYHPVTIANPAPLGLLGFSIAAFLSGLIKISSDELARSDGVFAAIAIFVGGVAQLVAGFVQFAKNETHSATAFSLYGLHWISYGVIVAISSLEQYSFSPRGTVSVAGYYALLTLATFALWLPTFRMNRVLNVTLGSVIIVLSLDAVAAGGWRGVEFASGVASCIAASFGFYLAFLDLINEAWRRPILPLFPHREHKADYDDSVGRPWEPRRKYHKSSVSALHL